MVVVNNCADVERRGVEMDGCKDLDIQVMVGPDDGAKDTVMRIFTAGPGGHTPCHSHPWEHAVSVRGGRGVIRDGNGTEREISAGDFVHVPEGEMHQFLNPFDSPFEFICVIPMKGQK